MIDPVGATAAATATIDQSLKLIRRVTTAIDHYKHGNSRLEVVCKDLCSTIDTIELVEKLEALRTKGVLKAVANMLKHAKALDHHVERVKEKSSTGSSIRRMAYQFMSGPEELECTNKMVEELTALKATLILQIQVAHVGLIVEMDRERQNNSGCTHMLNSVVLNQVNQVVEQRLGKGKGLKIAEVLQGKKPDGDGMIRLTKEEYECLIFNSSADDDGKDQLGQGTIRVADNRTFDQALQINGFVDEGWKEFAQNLIIENNEARNQGIQVNVPIKKDVFDQLLAERRFTIQSIPGPGQWPQPPPMPMPQQQANGLPPVPPAWSYPPWPYYGHPGVIENANTPGYRTQAAMGGPERIAMHDK
ncbi:hypothetical protein NW762_004032 [Fusarium torreyae]|uniref:Uncharacterized protein n=1 Tax=Fusarium torreyae TaxID=1237075 RepID=A0A9W8VKD9_9HYPO|nr:hypothetical protein NW762_004032 [Fusarium torreyae]